MTDLRYDITSEEGLAEASLLLVFRPSFTI